MRPTLIAVAAVLTVAVVLGMGLVTGAMAAWLTPELAADGYTEQDLQNALVRDGGWTEAELQRRSRGVREWRLMAPPTVLAHGVPDILFPDTDAPLARWSQIRTYATLRECVLGRLHENEVAYQRSRRMGSPRPNFMVEALCLPDGATEVPGLVIRYTPGRQIIVTVTLHGRRDATARLVLDTGADFTIVKPDLLVAAGVDQAARTGRGNMVGVTGKAKEVAYFLVSLEIVGKPIAISRGRVQALLEVGAHAQPDGSDGLLGRDFLDQFIVTTNPVAGTVTLVPLCPLYEKANPLCATKSAREQMGR